MTNKNNHTEDLMKELNIIKTMFSFYGFSQCPINDRYLKAFISMGFTDDKIYDIGCDMANGYGEITSLTDEEIKKMRKYL